MYRTVKYFQTYWFTSIKLGVFTRMTQNFLEECLKICGKSRWMSNLLFGKFPKYGRKSVEKTNSHNYCLMLVVFEWMYCELQNVKFLNLTSRWQRRTLRHIDKLIYIYKVCFTCKFWHLLRGMWIISTYTHMLMLSNPLWDRKRLPVSMREEKANQ